MAIRWVNKQNGWVNRYIESQMTIESGLVQLLGTSGQIQLTEGQLRGIGIVWDKISSSNLPLGCYT